MTNSENRIQAVGLFPTTSYRMLADAIESDPDSRRAALGELIRRYRKPLGVLLLPMIGGDVNRIDDIVQSFFTDRVLQNNLLALYDPSKGPFRTYLATAFRNHAATELRSGPKKKITMPSLRFEADDPTVSEPAIEAGLDDHFDRACALEFVATVLARLRGRYLESSRERLWEVFYRRLVAPALLGEPETPYEELAESLGFHSAKKAADAVAGVKRVLHQILQDLARETLDEDEDVGATVDAYLAILAKSRGMATCGLKVTLEPRSGRIGTTYEPDETALQPDLACLFEDVGGDSTVGPEELAVLTRHIIACPVQFYLPSIPAHVVSHRRRYSDASSISLGTLIHAAEPNAELIRLIKAFASDRKGAGEAWPEDLARIVYYTCIALLVRAGEDPSTRLDRAGILAGYNWAASRTWIGCDLREVFLTCLAVEESLDRED